ncbi:MAG TPA: histidine phosphatase family protein [Ktedonobacteraceae bacterium]|nr:histidine phosphatase family protein [Ktedonobacteraceae bacterium]
MPIIHFIRHGQSKGNVGETFPHPSDPPLTELGRQQAEHVRDELIGLALDPDIIIAGPARRHLETAAPTMEFFCKPSYMIEQTSAWGGFKTAAAKPNVVEHIDDIAFLPYGIDEIAFLNSSDYTDKTVAQRNRDKQAYFFRGDPDYIDGRIDERGDLKSTDAESFKQACLRVYSFLNRLERLETKKWVGPGESWKKAFVIVVFTSEGIMNLVKNFGMLPHAARSNNTDTELFHSPNLNTYMFENFYVNAVSVKDEAGNIIHKAACPIPNGYIMPTHVKNGVVTLLNNDVDRYRVLDIPPELRADPFFPSSPSGFPNKRGRGRGR